MRESQYRQVVTAALVSSSVCIHLVACAGGPVRAASDPSPPSALSAEGTALPATEPRTTASHTASAGVTHVAAPPQSAGSNGTLPQRVVHCSDVASFDRIWFVGEVPVEIGAFDVSVCRGTACEDGTVDWGTILPRSRQVRVDPVEFGAQPLVHVEPTGPGEIKISATFMDNSFNDGDTWSLRLTQSSSRRIVAHETCSPKWQNCNPDPPECYGPGEECRMATIRF